MQNWKIANPYKHLHCAKNMQIWNFTEQRTSSHWSSFLVWFQIPTFPQAPPFNIQFAYWTWNSYKTNPFLRHKTIRCLDIKSKRCEHNVDHLLECSFFVQLRWLENDGDELISHNFLPHWGTRMFDTSLKTSYPVWFVPSWKALHYMQGLAWNLEDISK